MHPVQQVRKTPGAWKGRPSDLEALGRDLGVIRVQEKPISVEGMSMRMPRGFRITLNSRSHPPSRKRFSWAHELGHIYSAKYGHVPIGPLRHDNKQLERRCDELASEFLMPYELFCEDMSLKPVSLRNALGLAGVYHTSATAAAIRYVELSEAPKVLVRWDCTKSGAGPLKLRWQIDGTNTGPRINCRWTPGLVGNYSSFIGAQKAFSSMDVSESTEKIFTRSSSQPNAYMTSQEYRVESKGFGKKQNRFVLSLIHL